MFSDDRQHRVGERGQVLGLPVVVVSFGLVGVEHALLLDVRLLRDDIDDGAAELLQRGQIPVALFKGSGMARDNADDGLASPVGGDERRGRREAQDEHERELSRGRSGGPSVELQDLRRTIGGPRDQASDNLGADGMQAVGERRHDAEIAPAPSDGPKQFRVLLIAGVDHKAVRCDDFDFE